MGEKLKLILHLLKSQIDWMPFVAKIANNVRYIPVVKRLKLKPQCLTNIYSFLSARSIAAMGITDCRVETVIEIERRFPFDAETENKLLSVGATLLSQKSFTDTYYDTEDFRLTGSDHWLRSRNGKWELKYPSPIRLSDNAAEYVECEDEDTLIEILTKFLGFPHPPSGRLYEILSNSELLMDFSTFRTTRKKFSFNGVTIDLDSADFGFAIGEMEVLIHKTGNKEADLQNHQNALKVLDETASILGIVYNPIRLPGKVATFLLRNRKKHYDFLIAKGVLKTESQ